MKKRLSKKYNQAVVRLFGGDPDEFPDFRNVLGDLRECLYRGRGADADRRIVGLALLAKAADCLGDTVNNQAEFQALLADAHTYLAENMYGSCHRDFELEAEAS